MKWIKKYMSSLDNEQPIKKKSLKSNFIFNFISQILVLIIPLATSPYLARVLGVEISGQISFATSIITYFTLASNFGFTTYGQREIARFQNDKEKRSQVFWEIFTIRLLFTLVSLSVLFSIIYFNVFDERYKTFLLIQTITVLACSVDLTFYYQGMEEFKLMAIRTVIVRIIGLVLVFSFVKTKDDAWLYVLFNAVTALVANIAMWPLIYKQTQRVKIKDLHIWRHFVPALLIFLPNLAVTIYSVLDKTMIGILSSNPDYDNGCYEKAYQLNSIMLLLPTLISSVMIPRNAHDFATGDIESLNKHIKFSFDYTWLVSIPLIVGCSVLCYSLGSWFLGDGYDEVPLLLQIMSVRFVASGVGVIVGDQIFIAIGKEKYGMISTTIGAIVNFSLNIVFIKFWGATGAAITTAITEVLVGSISLIIALKNKYINLKIVFSGMPKKLIAAGIMFIPIFFLNRIFAYSIWSFLLIMCVGVVTYALSLFILRDEFFMTMTKKGLTSVHNFLNRKKNNKEN